MPRRKQSQDSTLDLSEAGSSSQSQSSQRQSTQGKAEPKKKRTEQIQINENSLDFKRKVSEMVRYLLFADRKKTGIKRADIVKSVLKENPKWFNRVFAEACLKINQVFAFDVVPMGTDGKSKGFTLISAFDDEVIESGNGLIEWSDDSQEMGLLLIVLSLIFMNDGPLTEAQLWFALKKIGVDKDRQHRVVGDVDKLINSDFIKTCYLARHKEVSAEGATFTYSFGPRTTKEISKRKILTFVSEVYGYDDITKWKNQYEIILNEEENRGTQAVDSD